MSIKIVTDSASDILPAEAEKLGVTVVPLTINWDGQEYRDGVDMDPETFFGKLARSKTIPVTSQVSPEAFRKVFEELLAETDELIVITISSGLSGTCQSANIAGSSFHGRVHVVDSLRATAAERVLVLQALRYCEEGLAAAEIVRRLKEDRMRVRFLARLDTLVYLKKGGRIPPAVAFAGELLLIKPVITIDDKGAVALTGKARGSKKANNLLRKTVKSCGAIDFDCPICLTYSGLSDVEFKQYVADSKDVLGEHADELPTAQVGSVIGTHSGPGLVGLAFFENQNK